MLGLKTDNAPVKSDRQQWIEYNIGSGTLGIGCSNSFSRRKMEHPSLFEVADSDTAVATLRENNVPIIIGPMELPSCHMVTWRDPDGNKLTLHRRKS